MDVFELWVEKVKNRNEEQGTCYEILIFNFYNKKAKLKEEFTNSSFFFAPTREA